MRKIFFSLFLVLVFSFWSKAQTGADFGSDTACFGQPTSLVDLSVSTGNIIQVNWDIDSNGLFTDASGQLVQWEFGAYKTYKVGIQVISDLPDTAVNYKLVYLKPRPDAAIYQPQPQKQCLNLNAYDFYDTSDVSSGTIVSHYWDLGNGSTSVSEDTTGVVYFSQGQKNVMHVVTSDRGCVDTALYTVDIASQSFADFVINDSIQCLSNESFTFTDNSFPCDAVIDFAWDLDNDGLFDDSTGQNSITINFGDTGTYRIGLRVITLSDRDSLYKEVTILPSTTPGFAINDSDQCERGNSYDFTNASTLNSGTFTSVWKFGNGDTSAQQNVTNYTYPDGGNYTVTLVTTTDLGCVDSMKKNVHVFDNPDVSFTTNDTSQCLSDTFKFINTSSVAAPWSLVYSWSFGDGSTANAVTDTSHKYVVSGNYQVVLYATTDSACYDSFVQQVKVITKSIANFTIDDSIQCFGGNLFTFTNASTNCAPLDTVLWDLDNDGLFDDTSGTTFQYSFSAAGTYPVGMQLITTSDTSTITKNVYIYPQPQASFTVNDSTQDLSGNLFKFTNTSTISSGTINYSWFMGDGYVFGAKDVNKTYGKAGKYTVILYDTSDMGCTDSFIHNVYVMSPVTAGFRSTTVCIGDSTTLVDTSTGSGSILQYNWDLDNDGSFNDATGAQVKYLFTTADTFTVGLKVVTSTATDVVYNDVVVHPAPVADFTFTEACLGYPTQFTDKSTISQGNISDYYWDFDNNGIIDDSNVTVANKLYTLAGVYIAKLIAISDNGCTDETTDIVTVNQSPIAGFTFSDACVGDSVLFTNTSTVGGTDSIINYLWSYGDGIDAIIRNDHTHLYSTDGSYNARLVVLTDKNCKDTLLQTITIYPNPIPTLTLSGDTVFYEGKSVNITVNGSYNSILWSTNQTTATITATQTGTYTATVTDNNSCSGEASVQVLVNTTPDIEVVDVFTPNGDGVNDLFVLNNLEAFEPVSLTIFNRWGDEIYSSNDYKNDWDGTYKGKILSEGTYYYVLKTNGDGIVKGTISILK